MRYWQLKKRKEKDPTSANGVPGKEGSPPESKNRLKRDTTTNGREEKRASLRRTTRRGAFSQFKRITGNAVGAEEEKGGGGSPSGRSLAITTKSAEEKGDRPRTRKRIGRPIVPGKRDGSRYKKKIAPVPVERGDPLTRT